MTADIVDLNPSSLQEALNLIKFIQITHKEEISKFKEAYRKQSERLKNLEASRKQELSFLTSELKKYENSLVERTKVVESQILEKDKIIAQQEKIIENLKGCLNTIQSQELHRSSSLSASDSNNDSGIMEESDERCRSVKQVSPIHGHEKSKKPSRLSESMGFLRKYDFTPRKTKKDTGTENQDSQQSSPKIRTSLFCKQKPTLTYQPSLTSDDERNSPAETSAHFVFRPHKLNGSMTNHFSEDDERSEDTSEEIFDRVMTRSSVRRSVKSNPKYKKINRTKSKRLEVIKNVCN